MGVGVTVIYRGDASFVVVLDTVHLVAGEAEAGDGRPVGSTKIVGSNRGVQPEALADFAHRLAQVGYGFAPWPWKDQGRLTAIQLIKDCDCRRRQPHAMGLAVLGPRPSILGIGLPLQGPPAAMCRVAVAIVVGQLVIIDVEVLPARLRDFARTLAGLS